MKEKDLKREHDENKKVTEGEELEEPVVETEETPDGGRGRRSFQ